MQRILTIHASPRGPSFPQPIPSFPRRRESRRVCAAGPVILALRQYSQGGDTKTNQPTESPSPLMGEESKVRVTARQSHHRVIPSKSRNLKSLHHISPGPSYWLQGSIHRAGQQQDKPINPGPSFPRRRETTGQGRPGTTRHVIADLTRNPEVKGGETTSQTNHTGPSYWLQGSIHKTMHRFVPILKILIIPHRHSRVRGNPPDGAGRGTPSFRT